MATSKSNASDCFSSALRLLTGRDRSQAELSAKLQQLGFSASDIAAAIAKCHEYNYLNDQRFAVERARALFRSGRGVGRKVLFDLRHRGIDEATAQHALEKVEGEFETELLLREQLERRFPHFDYESADARQRRRVVSYFQRRGYSLDKIFLVLRDSQN